MGTNLCGFYVMEFMRTEVTEEFGRTFLAVCEQIYSQISFSTIHCVEYVSFIIFVMVNIHIDLLLHRTRK